MHTDRRGYGYRSVRRGGRVCREYLGKAAHLQGIAFLDSLDRAERDEQRDARRLRREQTEAQDAQFQVYFDSVTATVRAALESAGYHLHARSVWRKRRKGEAMAEKTMDIEIQASGEHCQLSQDEKRKLLAKASKGDKVAAERLLRNARDTPAEAALLSLVDTPRLAREEIIDMQTGESDALMKSLFRRKIDLMREELAGPSPSPLEQLLVERILNCWLQLHALERCANSSFKQMTLASHFDQRLDRAHKRYLSAIKALATVRKLQLPTVQVNIGEKQVNVAQINGGASG